MLGRNRSVEMVGYLERFLREEEGQDIVEYGLLIATIAIVVLITVGAFGNAIAAWFNTLAAKITTTGQ